LLRILTLASQPPLLFGPQAGATLALFHIARKIRPPALSG
jgi:hypothetical protein